MEFVRTKAKKMNKYSSYVSIRNNSCFVCYAGIYAGAYDVRLKRTMFGCAG